MEHAWVIWWTNHSSGPGSVNYSELELAAGEDRDAALLSFLADKEQECFTHSEHWRGTEGYFIDRPPRIYLAEAAGFQRSALSRLQDAIARTDALLALPDGEVEINWSEPLETYQRRKVLEARLEDGKMLVRFHLSGPPYEYDVRGNPLKGQSYGPLRNVKGT